MSSTSQRVWFVSKVLLTIVIVVVAFAVVIPNCIVPETVSHPRYFVWSGLIGPFLVSYVGVYCIWFWK
ncbi:MAG TPA: hypothetical protein VEC99_06775 [Clostridia bacterium]|nr:hypothetical protein [Clostridia bacterium]